MFNVAVNRLYIVRFLHQTTTVTDWARWNLRLYIVRFLHQTTTYLHLQRCPLSCISSVSYIKPQLLSARPNIFSSCISSVSYIKPQLLQSTFIPFDVVYRPFPTSNHNYFLADLLCGLLYIVRFLHQTTTSAYNALRPSSCISSVSYIKPQLGSD